MGRNVGGAAPQSTSVSVANDVDGRAGPTTWRLYVMGGCDMSATLSTEGTIGGTRASNAAKATNIINEGCPTLETEGFTWTSDALSDATSLSGELRWPAARRALPSTSQP